MSLENDDLIEIEARTEFLEAESKPSDNRFVFAYFIKIRNVSSQPAQLLRRHWIITDANGKVQEVRGEGVVGEQPQVAPGQVYQYASGAVLETAVGTMRGFYTMRTPDGDQFKAEIPTFTLSIPRTLH